jgi:hypothetical protein
MREEFLLIDTPLKFPRSLHSTTKYAGLRAEVNSQSLMLDTQNHIIFPQLSSLLQAVPEFCSYLA